MPELPEVEVLVRHLEPLLRNKRIRKVVVNRERVLRPTRVKELTEKLAGARFIKVERRAKFLKFSLRRAGERQEFTLVGHLGMTGRMYLLPVKATLPKHAAVVLDLDRERFVFEDTRYFGRLTLDTTGLEGLGPEPLGEEFTPKQFGAALKRSGQPIKVKLLDQRLVAGVGNIYASEALFRAGISPRRAASRLSTPQVLRLWKSIREVLTEAIQFGSTVALNYGGTRARDRLFYYGSAPESKNSYEERLRVYDREGKPCVTCRSGIRKMVQAARSTFFCPKCQGR
ncbi:MAG TPA: bifunctional DNA-formamidopyrimidine glycosylase/DNA-(apurinic or apyrimidinic site) lyase [Candidatus Dormibacteraeota bacterium]|nr:bifunctional DNA-formamidopyrimidine glycosylase/DNA-(apurinic or apyrimidinic site) lyase [Candidatus Dormibacteraeota bacterium]